jgi:hypothetical protein
VGPSTSIGFGGDFDICQISITTRIKLINIRKMGNDRGCMLSPTIIGGDNFNCRAR